MPTPPPRQRPTPRAFAVIAVIAVIAAVAFVAVGLVASISAAAQDAKRAAATTSKSAARKEILSVAEARKRPAGEVVTVEGFVTVPSGLFKSGTSDEGFALQDASGGIYVRTAANLRLRLGRQVRVTGQVSDSNGQLILLTADARGVSARGRAAAHTRAESVATARVNEATEGRLVRVTGTITKPVGNDLPYGYRLSINDGSGEVQAFVYVSTGINVSNFQPGQRVGVTGFGGQYNDHYEVIPRFRTDIQRIR
ncbi:MAG: hypothetical protein QOE47_289 [Pyrinomonadaceae bacterium]|jgi:uncharacterized protein YdeI (BOF family)|nr:hypothetical protein [Pyrinomonadaceae bacterium]